MQESLHIRSLSVVLNSFPASGPDIPEAIVMESFAKTLTVETGSTQSSEDGALSARRYQILLTLSGFFMIFQVNGINSIFGVFQEFYTSNASNIPEARGQDALVSLVGAIAYGLTYGGSIFVNPLVIRTEKIKFVTLSGAVIMSLSLILASFCTKLWHLYLSQAVLFGLGATLLYFPIISITPRYFTRRRGFAMGIVLAGNGVGALALSPTTQYLINRFGIRWALRILGLVSAATMTPVALVIQQSPGFNERRQKQMAKRQTVSPVLWDPVFYIQALGTALQAAANIIPMFYLNTFAISVLGYSTSAAAILLAINNATNSVSRVLMGILADRMGRQNVLISSVFASAISVLTLWLGSTRQRFLSFIILYGVFSGGYNALLPTTIAEVYGDENYDSVTGMIYFLRGIGTVIGPPTAGIILGRREGVNSLNVVYPDSFIKQSEGDRYDALALYTGMLLLGAGLCACAVRLGDSRAKGAWKWKA